MLASEARDASGPIACHTKQLPNRRHSLSLSLSLSLCQGACMKMMLSPGNHIDLRCDRYYRAMINRIRILSLDFISGPR